MTIWETMKERGEDFTCYDNTVDASVEAVDFDYDENAHDGYYDFLYELFRRIPVTEAPRYNMNTLSADFYGFIEKNINIFDKHITLVDEDPAALMTELLNDVCAGGLAESIFAELAADLRQLPLVA